MSLRAFSIALDLSQIVIIFLVSVDITSTKDKDKPFVFIKTVVRAVSDQHAISDSPNRGGQKSHRISFISIIGL
jgi:hypothetical protein